MAILAEIPSACLDRLSRPGAVAATAFLAIGAIIVGNALYHQPRPHPAPLFSTRASARAAVVVDAALIKSVQNALALSAYGPINADGVVGPETRTAIMRFERDHNLPVTGEISESLVLELRAAGAMTDS